MALNFNPKLKRESAAGPSRWGVFATRPVWQGGGGSGHLPGGLEEIFLQQTFYLFIELQSQHVGGAQGTPCWGWLSAGPGPPSPFPVTDRERRTRPRPQSTKDEDNGGHLLAGQGTPLLSEHLWRGIPWGLLAVFGVGDRPLPVGLGVDWGGERGF